jgi:hypothetical protein
MTLALWGVAWIAGPAALHGAGVSPRASLRRFAVALLPAVVIAGPYYATQLRTLASYIYLGFVTQRSIWARAADAPWAYYPAWTRELFAFWLYLIAAAFAVYALSVFRRRATARASVSGLLACLALAYIVPSAVPVRTMVFGAMLYGMIWVAGFVAVTHWPRIPLPAAVGAELFRRHPAALVSISLIAFGSLAVFEARDRQLRFPPGAIQKASIEYERTYALLKQNALTGANGAGPPRRLTVCIPTFSIAPAAYQLRAMQEGLDIDLGASGVVFFADMDLILRYASASDIVLIPDARLVENYFPYPANALMGDLAQWLRKDPKMMEGMPLAVPDGVLLVFRKRAT